MNQHALKTRIDNRMHSSLNCISTHTISQTRHPPHRFPESHPDAPQILSKCWNHIKIPFRKKSIHWDEENHCSKSTYLQVTAGSVEVIEICKNGSLCWRTVRRLINMFHDFTQTTLNTCKCHTTVQITCITTKTIILRPIYIIASLGTSRYKLEDFVFTKTHCLHTLADNN